MEVDLLGRFHVTVRVYKATAQADVVNACLMSARHTLPLRFEQNSFAFVIASLPVHGFILNDACERDYEVWAGLFARKEV